MAITERYTSRSQHITAEGTTLTQIWNCTDNDWNNWVAQGKPIIGTRWSPHRIDLRVTDIQNNWLSQDHCEVYVTYSTRGMPHPIARPDKISSKREVFDFQFTPKHGPEYVDTDGATQNWEGIYKTWKADATTTPPLYPDDAPVITVQATANVSAWAWYTINSRIGGVNKRNWLSTWGRRFKPREAIFTSTTKDPDVGKWLFSGFHAEKVGYGRWNRPNYELTYTFMYYHNGWNTPYGHPTTIKLYPIVQFRYLPKPYSADDKERYDLR